MASVARAKRGGASTAPLYGVWWRKIDASSDLRDFESSATGREGVQRDIENKVQLDR
jgi:hypothetical protein